MRRTDITMLYAPVGVRTESMYMPTDVPLSEMAYHDLCKGLCPRSRGKLQVCISDCPAPCAFGRELMRRCGQNE